ncbi:MAG: right-handed parallel beta-helix repeat-containing protein [Myxococcales bacterium]|nr:right-handed parallel beta-helix repeat-containing protein [Myxococcales bacterium]
MPRRPQSLRAITWTPQAVLVLLAGCGSLSSRVPGPPAGLVCNRVLLARADAASLGSALGRAQAGDCVVAEGGTYQGAFSVPADVSLAADEGAVVQLVGDQADAPALHVSGGRRSTIRSVRIVSAAGVGIVIDPGPAQLVDVSVQRASKSALLASCAGASCREQDAESTLKECFLTESGIGLWAAGARVRVEGGRVGDCRSTSLTTGHGVIASHGAALTLVGTLVEANADVGILLDGQATTAVLEGAQVSRNQGRGVWAQGLRGSVEAPALHVRGQSALEQNRLVGLGARDSHGIVAEDSTVQSTVAVKVPVSLGNLEDVGDGIGLFAGSGKAVLRNVTLRENARAQMLVDEGGSDISLQSGAIEEGPTGKYKLVVQRTTVQVAAPAALLQDPGRELPVSASALPIAQR